MDSYEKRRVCVLVKAYPQPSVKYEETVCVAAVTEDHRLLRLYPIRFRHLAKEQRFKRFDWIEVDLARATNDARPESYKIREESLRIVLDSNAMTPRQRASLWLPCVVRSLDQLKEDQKLNQKSLGVIKPDAGSLRFKVQPLGEASDDDQENARSVYHQQSLLEDPLTPLPSPEYVFRYDFSCSGRAHSMQLHDWEVETTYHKYKRRYGGPKAAIEKMVEFYEEKVPNQNPHLIMGNMQARPYQFIVIGVLRTVADIDSPDPQSDLFGI